MVRYCGWSVVVAVVLAVWGSSSARADSTVLAVTVGGKLGAGGNYLPAPDDKPDTAQPFDDGVGGYGITGGVFGEVRVLNGLLAAETGFIIDVVNNWSQLEPEGSGGSEFILGWTGTDLRIPLLFSVGTPGGGTRFALGTGPELVVPLSASPDVTVDRLAAGQSEAAQLQRFPYDAESDGHANWLFNLGLSSPVGPLRVAFDVRFALNLAAPGSYRERYIPGFRPLVTANHGMDLRILLGLGYDLI